MQTALRPNAVRLVAAAALVFTPLAWHPALAYHSLSAGAQACQIDRYQQISCSSDSGFGTDGTISYQTSLSGQQASVTLGYGVFKGSADVSVQTGPNYLLTRPFSIQSTGKGTSEDNWVISGGTGQGYLQFTWSIDGTASSFASGTPGYGNVNFYNDAFLSIDASVRAQTFGTTVLGSDVTTGPVRGGSGDYQMSGPVSFIFDRPIDVVFSASVVAILGAGPDFGGPNFSGEAHADFSHTARLTGIQVFEMSGRQLSNVSISAESGTSYSVSAVPEPSSAALAWFGMAVLAWRHGRQRGPCRCTCARQRASARCRR